MRIREFLYTSYGLLWVLVLVMPCTLYCYFMQLVLRIDHWQRVRRGLLWVLLRVLFIRVKVTGLENVLKGACIVAPEQLSHLDGAVILSLCDKPFFAITEPMPKFNFIFRLWMKKLHFVDVRRTEKEDEEYKKSHTRKQGIELARRNLKRGMSLLIFPEGHFERRKKLLHFYPGAVKLAMLTGTPLVPVAILGSEKIWPADHYLFGPGVVRIHFGKPLFLGKAKVLSDKLINEKTILLKKEVAEMLPDSFLEKGWQKNA